jgi:hypothetical protein
MRSPAPLAVVLALPLLAGTVAAEVRARHGVPGPASQSTAADDALHRPFDELLDLYVRDGYVYYGALKSDRAKLDRYLASLDSGAAGYQAWPADRQIALWLNAYDGFVLQAVVNNYPIQGRSPAYPPDSVRQVPGAFDRTLHRVGGRLLTLDAIERTVLAAFKDPRVYFALGRGADGSGRLRSEAYVASRLGAQLQAVAAETVTRLALFHIDQTSRHITVSAIFGWHEAEFVAAYGSGADARFGNRSPIERAIVAFAMPSLLPDEVAFVNHNDFQVTYATFDWRLNDLKTRR